MNNPASLPVNHFKQALAERRRQVGCWVTFTHPQVAEALADPHRRKRAACVVLARSRGRCQVQPPARS